MTRTATLVEMQTPRWIHWWAVLTVCATLPLLLLGAEVTTKQVGMVDPVGFREPWHLFVVLERATQELGFLIEHSHRLVGFVVGTCVIVLAAGLWLREPRRWVRWLGVAGLAAVSIQGLLGGFRVNLNALMGKDLALVHGCFAQLVFALLVSLALVTSRSWLTSCVGADVTQLQRWSLFAAGLVYVQLVLGGIVRHTSSGLGQRAHLLAAFGVVAAVIWLAKLVFDFPARSRVLTVSTTLLIGLVAIQLLLGVEAWMIKFSSGMMVPDLKPITASQSLVRTLHFLAGSGIFSTSVVIALWMRRQQALAVHVAPALVEQLGGAA